MVLFLLTSLASSHCGIFALPFPSSRSAFSDKPLRLDNSCLSFRSLLNYPFFKDGYPDLLDLELDQNLPSCALRVL